MMHLGITKTNYGMENGSDFPPDVTTQRLVSLICSFPFKGDDDYQEISSVQLEKASRMLQCQTVETGLVSCDNLKRRRDKLLRAFHDWFYSSIENDESTKSIHLYRLLVCRSSIELSELTKELTVSPGAWIDRLKSERNYYSSILLEFVKSLEKVSLEIEVKLMLEARKWLGDDGHHSDIWHARLAIENLGPHPFFDQLIPFGADAIAQVGSNLTGVPAPWLSSCLKPPKSWPSSLLKKFPAHFHATTVLDNFFASAAIRYSRPLAIFLVHDPGLLCIEEFASNVSESLYGTRNLSLRFDLSADTQWPNCSGVENQLSELLVKVNKSPFSIVLLEKIEKANDSLIEELCFCLTNGHTLQGTSVDFSRTIFFLVFDGRNFQIIFPNCGALHPLLSHSGRKLMDVALDNSTCTGNCLCKAVIAKVKAKLKPELWNLVDDVLLLDVDISLVCYTRCLLREISGCFCDGSLIIYPSESALSFISRKSNHEKGSNALNRWLKQQVVPALEAMEADGYIDGESIVFIDTCVANDGLSYRVEEAHTYQLDEFAQNFTSFADDWLAIYENGKIFEENMNSLRERLDEICKSVEGDIEEQLHSLIQLVDMVVKAANDIHTSKEALGYSVEKFDTLALVPVKQKVGGALTLEGNSKWTKLINVLMENFSSNSGSKLMPRSPSSYLIFGLNYSGKKKLLNELKKNDMGIHLFELDELECSQEQFMNKSSSNGYGWLHVIEHVKHNSRCILFFDRIERAPMLTFSMLVSLLRHGLQVDCDGNRVDFGETVVIISTDVGNKDVLKQLVPHSEAPNDIIYPASQEEATSFRSELLNKVAELVVLNPFTSQQLTSITRIPITAESPDLGKTLKILFGECKSDRDYNCIRILFKEAILLTASRC